MATRTFTDEAGQEFELDVELTEYIEARNNPAHPKLVIRPIKVEKKLYSHTLEVGEPVPMLINKSYLLTEPTAQKVAEAIIALMEFIQGEGKDNGQWPAIVTKARAAFQEEV